MPRRKKKKKKKEDVYTSLSIQVTNYEIRSEASVNYSLHIDNPWFINEDEPLYAYGTFLHINGISSYPPERAAEEYRLSIRTELDPLTLNLKIKDVHKKDEDKSRMYRTYRGREVPIYDPPLGISTLNRRRGEKIWDAYVTVAPQLITDMIILILSNKQLYLSIHERKSGKQRWIQNLSLQTVDPEYE